MLYVEGNVTEAAKILSDVVVQCSSVRALDNLGAIPLYLLTPENTCDTSDVSSGLANTYSVSDITFRTGIGHQEAVY